MSFLDRFAMKTRCGDCAFTPGSDAHASDITRATAELCVVSGEPFACHRSTAEGEFEARLNPDGEPVLCRGFVEAFTAHGPQDDWRAAVASAYLRILEDVAAGRLIPPDEIVKRVTEAGR